MKRTIPWGMMKIVNKKTRELNPAEYNPRQLTEKQYENLKESITRYGFVDPIVVNKNKERKNIIVGGHQRHAIAKMMGMSTVPCVEVNLSLEDEQELNIRLNKNVGEWDWEMLANNFDTTKLIDWGFSNQELSWNETPTNEDWATYFEEKGDTSGVDDRHQITFILNQAELKKLTEKLAEIDKNKNVALMMLV